MAWRRANSRIDIAESLSAPSESFIAFAGGACAMSDEQTLPRPSFRVWDSTTAAGVDLRLGSRLCR